MLLNVDDISKVLKKNSIQNGDNIFLHVDAFVTAFLEGNSIENKMDTLINGITNCIGPTGTLVLPTFTYSATKNNVYDPDKTQSEVGIVTEYFRKKKNKVRS